MQLLSGKDAVARITGMISPKHQVHGYAVNLTVKNISAVDPVGMVDLGGNEYRSAESVSIAAQRRTTEDKYLWWDISRGAYFVEFNETIELAPDEIAFLEPDDRLIRAGATHSAVMLRGRMAPVETLLDVPVHHVQIKQNARISLVRIFRFDTSGPQIAALSKVITVQPARPSPKGKKRK
ncbi:MAG: hypothetical protein HY046_13385 [Acidobacteria bacterium]|nr:hypothetical protein [Acidobacteriota bacterium]